MLLDTISNYKVIHNDNLAYLKNIEDGFFNLIVTSPPYNIGKEYEKKKSLDDYLLEQELVIKECTRVLNDKGSICWQVGNYVNKGEVFPLDIFFYEIFKKYNLKLRNRIIWHYGHGLHAKKRLSGRYETILWFTKSDEYYFNLDPIRIPPKYPNKKYFKGKKKGQLSCNPKGKNPSDVWDIPNVKANHCEKTEHPAQFPVELVERLVLSMTKEGDKVFDPFLGSGTTIIAAVKNNRYGYGCEIEKKYIEIVKNRLKLLSSGELKIRKLFTPIYNPNEKYGGQKIENSRNLFSS